MTSLFHHHNFNPVGPDMPLDAKILVNYPMAIVRRIMPTDPNFWNLRRLNEFHPCEVPNLSWEFVRIENWIWHYSLCTSAKCLACDGNGWFDHCGHDYDCQSCEGDGTGESVMAEEATARMNFEGQILDIIETGVS